MEEFFAQLRAFIKKLWHDYEGHVKISSCPLDGILIGWEAKQSGRVQFRMVVGAREIDTAWTLSECMEDASSWTVDMLTFLQN
jgi:hypothetical protein